jgi:hypothetical protein
MSHLSEIEAAIERLPREDAFTLAEWLREHLDDEWDREFEADVASGRLDTIAERAIDAHRAGNSTPFPPDAE